MSAYDARAPAGLGRMRKQPKVASARIEAGSKVRVLGGPFAGRVGAIVEIDGKGGARVTFGSLQAHVELSNLGLAGVHGTRPALRSSHRRFDVPAGVDGPKEGSGGSSSKGRKPARPARTK